MDYSTDDRKASDRMTRPEAKALEDTFEDMYRDIRIGAEVHRTVSCGQAFISVEFIPLKTNFFLCYIFFFKCIHLKTCTGISGLGRRCTEL